MAGMATVITAGQGLPTPDPPLRDGAVLIRDERIAAVGPRATVVDKASSSAMRWDFPTGTLMAGLFNTHVHLAFDASTEFLANQERATREELQASAVDRLRKLLRSGVTTVRDLGDRDNLAVSVRAAL